MRNGLLLMFIFMISFSSEIHANDCLDVNLLAQLYSLQDPCIINVKEGKYYLNSEKITISENRISLNSDTFGELSISHLIQDPEGIYVSPYVIYCCNGCGAYYPYLPSKCTRDDCDSTSFTAIEQLPDD